MEPTFDFLVENQWWPGLTFTDPQKTEYLLSRIDYPRVGIMLDTGHLMNLTEDDCRWAGFYPQMCYQCHMLTDDIIIGFNWKGKLTLLFKS